MRPERDQATKSKGHRKPRVHAQPPLEPKQGVYGSGGSYGIGGGFDEGGTTLEQPETGCPVEHKGPVPTND